MDRFFLIVRRANSLILFALMLGGAFLFGINLWPAPLDRPLLVRQADPDIASRLRLEEARKVRGTETYYAMLVSEVDERRLSSGPHGEIGRNVLFIQGNAGSAAWLFPTNAQILRKITPLPRTVDSDAPPSSQPPVLAFYMEVVSADTDGDGGMGWSDAVDIALSKPDGTKLTTVLTGVSRVLALDTVGDSAAHAELVIIYQTGLELRHGRIGLEDFKLLSSDRIANMPKSL